MRKSALSLSSLVCLSIFAAAVSACSPSMMRFTELTPRVVPNAVEPKVAVDSPATPLSKVNAQ